MSAGGGAVYGLGLLGALVYFLENAVGLEAIIVGIVKAIFWPAFFVYQSFKFFGL